MKTKMVLLAVALSCGFSAVHAQALSDSLKKIYSRNNIKVNIPAIFLFSNYGFSYERMIARKISLTGSYRYMPSKLTTNISIGKILSDKIDNDDVIDIYNTEISNNTYTLEVRKYGGRHPGARGFYAAAYLRYASFKATAPFHFTAEDNTDYSFPIQMKANGLGGGLMIGAQWIIAKRVSLDWFILGAHHGGLKGNISATQDFSALSTEGKQQLQDDINNVAVIGDTQLIQSEVTDSGVTGTITAPFIGLRGGISIGVVF